MDRVTSQGRRRRADQGVRPEQQIVKIVHDELIELMGPVDPSIRFEKTGPTVLMLCGLQGSGKTTTCGKLARLLAEPGPQAAARRRRPPASRGRRAAQGHRPAARRSRLQPGRLEPGQGLPGRARRGQPPGSRHDHPRHRRPAAHRRRADGRAVSRSRRRSSRTRSSSSATP